MVPQFIQDFVHFERGKHGLDQHRALDRALRHAHFALRHHKDVVPQPRFQVAFDFRQVEVRAGILRE